MLRISQPPIISFVRLLGKHGIFRPLLEYCTLSVDGSSATGGAEHRGDRSGLASGVVDKNAAIKIGTGIPRQGFRVPLGSWRRGGSWTLPLRSPAAGVSLFAVETLPLH
jgi:hypothetical protein